jgi:beta-glucosidase
VQLYLRDVVASVTRPVLELKAFQRITLSPGQAEDVTFTLGAAQLGFLNASLKSVVEPGRFEILVGPSSAEGLRGSFEVSGKAAALDRTTKRPEIKGVSAAR